MSSMTTRNYGSSASTESPLLAMASEEEASGSYAAGGGNSAEKETPLLYHRGGWEKSATVKDDFVSIEVSILYTTLPFRTVCYAIGRSIRRYCTE